MADRAYPVNPVVLIGAGAAALVLALILGSLGIVAARAEAFGGLHPSDWAAVRFTVLQATLSAALSTVFAVFVARAFGRRRFPGKSILIALMGAPFILPVIVAIFGLLAVFGQNGILAAAFGIFGLAPPRIYGMQGVLLAHVFFNLPLATRIILQGWNSIPAERFRLAASMGMGPRDVFRIIEWPMLRQLLPGAFLVVFLVCLTSFAVALTLGGGPRATTIELAIYQAFRFDFDLSKAAMLGLVQVCLTAVAALVAWRITVPVAFGAGLDRAVMRWDAQSPGLRIWDTVCITVASAFLLAPIVAVAAAGVSGIAAMPETVWQAAARSLAVALSSAFFTMFLAGAFALSTTAIRARHSVLAGALESVAYLTVATSPLVIGTGLFILIFPIADPSRLALPVTAVVNAVMSLPFALRVLLPALEDAHRDFARLTESLGMPPGARLRLVYLPRMRAPIGFGFGLAAALSMGDLGVIALFADAQSPTLPLQVYRLMAAYRMEDAAAAALLLAILSLSLFWIFDRGGRGRA